MFGTVRCAENYGYLIMVILQGFGGFIIVVICPGLCPGTCTLRGDASPPKKQTSESHAHYYMQSKWPSDRASQAGCRSDTGRWTCSLSSRLEARICTK